MCGKGINVLEVVLDETLPRFYTILECKFDHEWVGFTVNGCEMYRDFG